MGGLEKEESGYRSKCQHVPRISVWNSPSHLHCGKGASCTTTSLFRAITNPLPLMSLDHVPHRRVQLSHGRTNPYNRQSSSLSSILLPSINHRYGQRIGPPRTPPHLISLRRRRCYPPHGLSRLAVSFGHLTAGGEREERNLAASLLFAPLVSCRVES